MTAFRVKHFGLVWFGGLIWHLCRWGVAFLGTFLVNELTGSPRLVQLAGAALYAPLLLGGIAGGVISDRFNRLRTVQMQMALVVPLSITIGVLVRSGDVQVWMIYLYMFIVGIGWVTDMTSRRALVFDLVGEERLDNAMALESLSLSMGMVLGALVGGAAVEAVGVGASYFCIAAFSAVALVALMPVKAPTPKQRAAASPREDLVEGFRMLRTRPGIVSILGVTVIANFFLFAYFPLVPVLAGELGVSPFLVGLLLSGTGMGMMIGSIIVARWEPGRRGVVYLFGLCLAMVFVIPFALSGRYTLALLAIVMSGVGSGLFAATQTTLVVAEASEEARGRSLGLLSMAIGALPVGMYVLGEVAERIGPTAALVLNSVIGLIALFHWVAMRPEVRSMRMAESA